MPAKMPMTSHRPAINPQTYIGTAAWNIPRSCDESFPKHGSHLERYASVFNAVEINSSFYKDHKKETYEKWSRMVPDHFRFCTKLSKAFTHDKSEIFSSELLTQSLETMSGLGEKWRVLLMQYPASIPSSPKKLEALLKIIRKSFKGSIVIEARNLSWTEVPTLTIMKDYNIGFVRADPDRCPYPHMMGDITYERLHGSPDIYRSSYAPEVIDTLAETLSSGEHWIIFDNTTLGHATQNALDLQKRAGLDPKDLA